MCGVFKRVLVVGFVILLILLGCAMEAHAQEAVGIIKQLQQFHPEKGNITVNQDEKIKQLLNTYYIQNAVKPGMQGFRIRIFIDLDQVSRAKSQEVMNEFMENFPGISTYRTFDSPYYKVSIGDFRTRDEAIRMQKKLNRKYPKAFIIPEWINFPQND